MSSMLGYEEIELDNEEISFSILNGEKSQDGPPSNKTNTTKPTDKCTTVFTAKTDAKNVKSLMSQLKTLNVTSSKVFLKSKKKVPKSHTNLIFILTELLKNRFYRKFHSLTFSSQTILLYL